MYNKEIILRDSNLNCGYYYFIDKEHPLATGNSGRVLLHRHVASLALGRWLDSTEHVHHIDEDKLNNDPSNLQVLTVAEHNKIHFSNLIPKECLNCKKIFIPTEANKQQYCSQECSKAAKIKNKELTKEILDELIPKHSWVALGKMFGYSDSGIKKRAKALGCIIPVRNIRKI